jgi:hypothetical protein
MPKRGRCLAQWANPVNPLATKADLRELELRVRLHLGAYVFAAAGLVIAVLIAYMELRG